MAHFITDDIISVDIENNIFNGLHIVSLNMDSANMQSYGIYKHSTINRKSQIVSDINLDLLDGE